MFKFVWIAAVFIALSLGGCAVFFPPMHATAEQAEMLQATREFEGLSQDELYQRALDWGRTRPDLTCRDLDEKKEMIPCEGSGAAAMDFGQMRPFYYDLLIDVKDGKLRTRFENIWGPDDTTAVAGPNMKLQWSYVEGYFDGLKADLFRFIGNPVGEPWQLRNKARDDW
jgi:hypothetical protein